MMMCSMALTRRFVSLMASSSVTNEVCSDASLMRCSSACEKFVRHFRICSPPLPRPVISSGSVRPPSSYCWKTGILTPATLSSSVLTLVVAWLTFSVTKTENSPAK
eukprot:Amastigsp_a841136_964.p2 type:complete len:106 gc:universal Amastigsp_a841136_964:300-617(+)